MRIKLTIEQIKNIIDIPEHDCNPEPAPPVLKGKLRMRRYPMFDECGRCYAKLEYTKEQWEARLGLLGQVVDKIKE